MTRWGLFLAGTTVIVVATVALAALTARSLVVRRKDVDPARWGDPAAILGVSRTGLYLNAAASQGLLLAALVGLVVLTGVSSADLGVLDRLDAPVAVAAGIALGLGLAAGNLGLQRALDALGIPYDDSLRDLLSPASAAEWAVLLIVVLPVVAGFEELLFRGALIGALAAGYTVSPWLLAVVSSVLFAAGHGLQGPGGLLAAGLLGLALAVAFVLSGSLLVVIVAHYVVNAVEFAVHR